LYRFTVSSDDKSVSVKKAPIHVGAFKVYGGPDITLPKLVWNSDLRCGYTTHWSVELAGGPLNKSEEMQRGHSSGFLLIDYHIFQLCTG
jgi:hypothetical protein